MIITFTCPNCGCQQLTQIRQTIHRAEVKLSTGPSGEMVATPVGVDEKLPGPILGYRCSRCRYPDNQNHDESGGFFWNELAQVQAAGVCDSTDKVLKLHHCMICHGNGRTQPLVVKSAGSLSLRQRQQVLSKHGVTHGVLLCEGDPGIGTFEKIDWNSADCEEI